MRSGTLNGGCAVIADGVTARAVSSPEGLNG